MSNETPWSDPALSYQSLNMQLPPVRSRAKFAITTMIALMVCSVLLMPALFAAPWVHTITGAGTGTRPTASPATLIIVGLSMCLIGFLQIAVSITFIVFFCMWTHSANRAARFTGAVGMEFTPGWAVGWFFIPFANLVMPFRMMKELWKTSDPAVTGEGDWRTAAVPPLVAFWWTAWLANAFFGMSGSVVSVISENKAVWTQTWLQFASTVMQLIAGYLLIRIIRQITDRLLLRAGQSPG